MPDWLSFWNQETRARNADLAGGPVDEIYVPYGRGKIGRRDRIYCVGIEHGRLLTTRVRAALLQGDIADDEMIYIDDSDEEYVEADFNRTVPRSVLDTLTLIYADGSDGACQVD